MDDLVVWAADVGSIRQQRFGWCRAPARQVASSGTDIRAFAAGITADLNVDYRVAVGFECPLFVPISTDPLGLTSARVGEGSRAWSVHAGANSLVTGLTECVWVFEQLRTLTNQAIRVTLDWQIFHGGGADLFIWEAFISGMAKGDTHHKDAAIAAQAFWSVYPDISAANAVRAENPYSLVGAALLRAGLSDDLTLLSQPCIVIKASPAP